MGSLIRKSTSPVNIIIVTTFADQLADDEGTWIMTKCFHSAFTSYFGRHSIKLVHPHTRLPTMTSNQGFSDFKSVCTFLSRTGVMPSCSNAAYILQTALVNAVSGSGSIDLSEIFNTSDILKFNIDNSYIFVYLIDIDIIFETIVSYFKIKLKNGFERKFTKVHLSPNNDTNLF